MTLKDFLDACENKKAFVELFNVGGDAPFATVSVDSVDFLLATIQSKTVQSFTAQSNAKIVVHLA